MECSFLRRKMPLFFTVNYWFVRDVTAVMLVVKNRRISLL